MLKTFLLNVNLSVKKMPKKNCSDKLMHKNIKKVSANLKIPTICAISTYLFTHRFDVRDIGKKKTISKEANSNLRNRNSWNLWLQFNIFNVFHCEMQERAISCIQIIPTVSSYHVFLLKIWYWEKIECIMQF